MLEISLSPLTSEGPIILSHAVVALAALALGLAQFALPKGTALHRTMGWAAVAGLAFVAVGSFWIHGFRLIGPFGPIHILSVLALVGLWREIRAARQGRVAAHRDAMISLFAYTMLIAGAFTLLPGRAVHAVLFGG